MFFNFSHKRPAFAFAGKNRYTLAFAQKIAHNGTHGETGAFPPPATARLCAASEIFLFRHAFIYIHFPVLCEPSLSATVLSQTIFHRVFQPFAQMAHTAKQGVFQMGVVSLSSERSTRFGNPTWPGFKTAYFAAFGPWSGVLSKNTESLRNSDALMRVAVPKASRPRWAA